MARDLNEALTALIEALSIEPDPAQRDRLLLSAAEESTGAQYVGLWHQREGSWSLLGERGDVRWACTEAQVTGVAEGVLPSRIGDALLCQAGAKCLVGAGLPPGLDAEDVQDLLESLLITQSMLGIGEAADDVIHPALPESEPQPGTHALDSTDLSDLRHLLGHLSESEARWNGEPDELDLIDRSIEHAGDLLLGRLGSGSASPKPRATTLGPTLEAVWMSRARPRRLWIDPAAAVMPLGLEPGALLALLLMLIEMEWNAEEYSLHVEQDGSQAAVVRVEHETWHSNPPKESSLSEIRSAASQHDGVVRTAPNGIEIVIRRESETGEAAA